MEYGLLSWALLVVSPGQWWGHTRILYICIYVRCCGWRGMQLLHASCALPIEFSCGIACVCASVKAGEVQLSVQTVEYPAHCGRLISERRYDGTHHSAGKPFGRYDLWMSTVLCSACCLDGVCQSVLSRGLFEGWWWRALAAYWSIQSLAGWNVCAGSMLGFAVPEFCIAWWYGVCLHRPTCWC